MTTVETSNTTNQSLIISDDSINFVFNVFTAESMKYYKNILVSLNRNFINRKITNPDEWKNCRKVIELCDKYHFNLKCYIKYCFIHKLATHNRGHVIADISKLTKFSCIAEYEREQKSIEQLYNIYMAITKSIMGIKNICREHSCSSKEAIIKLINSGRLMSYIATGMISRYFLSLIPNAKSVLHKHLTNANEHRVDVYNICSRIEEDKTEAYKALMMFYPSAIKKSIIDLCS